MSNIEEVIKELHEAEAAFIVLILPKPENEDDQLQLQVETNLLSNPQLAATILDTAFSGIIGEEVTNDEL